MKEILYISYDGLIDPLGKSQILPYLEGLSDAGYQFNILSFEKIDCSDNDFYMLNERLKRRNIEWFRLSFRKGRFQGIFRIIKGASLVRKICNRKKIDVIHLRAILPAIIYILSFVDRKFIYDIRSFAGQWVDSKAIKKGSILESIFYRIEKYLINKASAIVVLDISGADYLNRNYRANMNYKIIPTSTNLSLYDIPESIIDKNKYRMIKFVYLGGASFPYLPFEAIRFVKHLIDLGINCSLDIINKNDHLKVRSIVKKLEFPIDKIKIFSLAQEKIPHCLPNYDCGLIFLSTGPWIRMCSPTKIGEYLASGLFVIGLDGIEVLERFSARYNCIEVIPRSDEISEISLQKAKSISNKILNTTRQKEARLIAIQEYDLNKAVLSYVDLYKTI